jgi:hypothetical protein
METRSDQAMPMTIAEGQSLAAFGDALLVHAQRRRMTDGASPLDERNVRILREILDGVKVAQGQTAYLARWPIECLLDGTPAPTDTSPHLAIDDADKKSFDPVVMATQTLAIQNDSLSDESFVRRARETLRGLMEGADVVFVYQFIVHPSHHDGSRAWSVRYGRWRRP